MKPTHPLLSLILLPALLLSAPLAADMDARLRACHDQFTRCMERVPEAGPDGRYPLHLEQACEVAHERCKVSHGYAPSAAHRPPPSAPDHD